LHWPPPGAPRDQSLVPDAADDVHPFNDVSKSCGSGFVAFTQYVAPALTPAASNIIADNTHVNAFIVFPAINPHTAFLSILTSGPPPVSYFDIIVRHDRFSCSVLFLNLFCHPFQQNFQLR
jgi:hypothetical protein